MKYLETTPKQDGFRMPGEFEPHERCWMIWPQRRDTFRYGGKLAQKAFIQFAQAISRFEPVTVCVNADQYDTAIMAVGDFAQVVELSNDDFWIRDSGATFVTNGKEIRGVDWSFNAWGGLVDGLYFPWDKDDRVADKMCRMVEVDSYRLEDFILEGGSIHVDNIFNFVKPGECVLAWTDDESDPQYEISKECYEILSSVTDAKGRKLKIHKLHIPNPIYLTEEEREGRDQLP